MAVLLAGGLHTNDSWYHYFSQLFKQSKSSCSVVAAVAIVAVVAVAVVVSIAIFACYYHQWSTAL